MHVPGPWKNFATALAIPAPAWSINASTSTPRAKAALSALRICAEVKTGNSNQASRFSDGMFASDLVDFVFFFFFFFEDLELDFFFRERLELLTLVWSMYGWSGMVATAVELVELLTLERARTPAAISSASFWR